MAECVLETKGEWVMPMKTMRSCLVTLMFMASAVGCFSQEPIQMASASMSDQNIYSAIENGDLDNVRRILQGEADVNAKGSKGETPLLFAADRGRLEIVQYLLANDADINATDNRGWTSLSRASFRGHLEIVKCLMGNEAGINEKHAGQTPLYSAAQGGSLNVVEFFLDKGADIDARDEDNWTPLMIASMNGHLEVVRFLVQKGADINAKDDQGWLPLFEAARLGHMDVAEFLLGQYGAAEE